MVLGENMQVLLEEKKRGGGLNLTVFIELDRNTKRYKGSQVGGGTAAMVFKESFNKLLPEPAERVIITL